jgi:hypothetical protein
MGRNGRNQPLFGPCRSSSSDLNPFSPFSQQFDKVMQARRAEIVHAEWVMSPHQLLPQNNNWAWALATEPELLRLVRAHLVRRRRPRLVVRSSLIQAFEISAVSTLLRSAALRAYVAHL